MLSEKEIGELQYTVGGNLFVVAYMPNLSLGFKMDVAKNITPEMHSEDETTGQYLLASIYEAIKEGRIGLNDKDDKVLKALTKLNCQYVEF